MSSYLNKKSTDVALLAAVRIVTLVGNLASTAILSRALTLADYGTYSASNIIVTVASSVTILGFMDATNYFYNLNSGKKEGYINTIFAVQMLIGLICGAIILLAGQTISKFLGDPALNGLYLYIAFRPLLLNIADSLLALQASIGKARAVAVRNGITTLLRLIFAVIVATVFTSVEFLLLTLIFLDLITIIFYYSSFKHAAFHIKPWQLDSSLLSEILAFSIPMGIYVMLSTLMKETDKTVIAFFMSPADLAVYSNCSKPLPLSIISSAFLTVFTPALTRFIQNKKFENAKKLCETYLKIGYMTAFVFAGACIIFAAEAIQLLYGEKYLTGKWVFVIYILIDMLKFSNITIVLAAKGKTKKLMFIAAIALWLNIILNVVLYKLVGMIGPAVASLLITIMLTGVLLVCSAKEMETGVWEIIHPKKLCMFLIVICFIGSIFFGVRHIFLMMQIPFYVILALGAFMYCVAVFSIYHKEIIISIREINRPVYTDILE